MIPHSNVIASQSKAVANSILRFVWEVVLLHVLVGVLLRVRARSCARVCGRAYVCAPKFDKPSIKSYLNLSFLNKGRRSQFDL